MLDESLIGKEPNPTEIEKLIETKKLDLERMQKNFEKKEARRKEQLAKMKQHRDEQKEAKKIKRENRQKGDADSSDDDIDDDDIDLDMNDEQREELIRQQREKEKKVKLANIEIAETRELYFNRIKTETLKSFKDVPDEVKSISILKVTNSAVLVDWSAPENNGSEITEYRIHISKKMISDLGSAGMTI